MSTDLKALKIKNLLLSETFNPEELAALCSEQFEQKNYESLSLDSHYKIKNYCLGLKLHLIILKNYIFSMKFINLEQLKY